MNTSVLVQSSGCLDSPSITTQLSMDRRADDVEQSLRHGNNSIVSYLQERVAEFALLSKLREQGWKNPVGDAYFERQRRNADRGDERTAIHFYKLMQRIGKELQECTNAFTIQPSSTSHVTILDMCMAPGGFLATALSHSPGSRALAFSLPSGNGGHKVLLPRNPRVETRFLDITMLAADMGMADIPVSHPDAGNFLPRQVETQQLFDLVICDGQVLRTHTRPGYREKREARRLITTQLALGLEHLRVGGTMIVLLHKVEAWDTVTLLSTFRKFSSIRLFKPTTGHATRSSFYMIATNIRSDSPAAIMAIELWKTMWRVATFGSDEEYSEEICNSKPNVSELLQDFGAELVQLGREVWKVQADALTRAPFVKARSF